ncbi:hypothetical protein P3H15_39295, partial [Rhodococcus sp. T2V]|uniref:hypothetical protein n=1 Tax=Rhodococcus sp. T2V TaxID=3034164 RepID=UPI0023E17575
PPTTTTRQESPTNESVGPEMFLLFCRGPPAAGQDLPTPRSRAILFEYRDRGDNPDLYGRPAEPGPWKEQEINVDRWRTADDYGRESVIIFVNLATHAQNRFEIKLFHHGW